MWEYWKKGMKELNIGIRAVGWVVVNLGDGGLGLAEMIQGPALAKLDERQLRGGSEGRRKEEGPCVGQRSGEGLGRRGSHQCK